MKEALQEQIDAMKQSPPAREAWIESQQSQMITGNAAVASREGGVD